jgi:hypothetical protein
MPISGTVPLTGIIAPTSKQDKYAVFDMVYGKDGLRNVDTTTDRNNIPPKRRKIGMLVGTKRILDTSPEEFETDQDGNYIIDIYQLVSDSGTTTTSDSDWKLLMNTDTSQTSQRYVSTTASEFISDTQNNNLKADYTYVITDYHLHHFIHGTNNKRQSAEERIMIKTDTDGAPIPQGKSLDFPQDIIYYDPLGDNANTNQIPVNDSLFRGFIYRRVNPEKQIDIGFDFRNVKFPRWKVSDTDAENLGIPINTYDVDLYILPNPTTRVGWTFGTLYKGNKTDGDTSVYNSDNAYYGSHELITPNENDYKLYYPIFDSREPEASNFIEDLYMNKCSTFALNDQQTDISFAPQINKWNLPNITLVTNVDSFHSSIGNIDQFIINARKYGNSHLLNIYGFMRTDANAVFTNNIVLSVNGGGLIGEYVKDFTNNIILSNALGIGVADTVTYNSFLGYLKYNGTILAGQTIANVVEVIDSSGNRILAAPDSSSFTGNRLFSTSGLHVRGQDQNLSNFINNHIRGRPENAGEPGGDFMDIYIDDSELQNQNYSSKILNSFETKISTFKTAKSIDNTENYDPTNTKLIINSITYDSASQTDVVRRKEANFYGIFELTSTNAPISIEIDKIENPPEHDFILKPTEGIEVTITKNKSAPTGLRPSNIANFTITGGTDAIKVLVRDSVLIPSPIINIYG